MPSAKSVGRTVGVLSILRGFVAPPAYFGLLPAVTSSNFLVTAAASETKVRIGLLLTYGVGVLTLAVALVAYPFFRQYGERTALTFLLLSALGVALLAIDDAGIMRMLALSQEYVRAGAPVEYLQPLGRAARVSWLWSHFTNLTVGHLTGIVFSWILYRHALVPRLFAGAALLASVLGTIGVVLPLLGYRWQSWTLVPAGLVHLALMVWLIVRGFTDRPLPTAPA